MTPQAPITAHTFSCKILLVGIDHRADHNHKLRFNRQRRELRTFQRFVLTLLRSLDEISKPRDPQEISQIGRITWTPIFPKTEASWQNMNAKGWLRHTIRECELRVVYVHAFESETDETAFDVFHVLLDTLDVLNLPHGPGALNTGFRFNQGLSTPSLRVNQFEVEISPTPAIELAFWCRRNKVRLAELAREVITPEEEATIRSRWKCGSCRRGLANCQCGPTV